MPTYQYSCTECGHFAEVVQSFTDDSLTVCPECGGRLRKVFGAVGVVFKGSGFYRTDSRGKESGSDTAAPKESSSTSSSSTSSSSSSESGSGSSTSSTSPAKDSGSAAKSGSSSGS